MAAALVVAAIALGVRARSRPNTECATCGRRVTHRRGRSAHAYEEEAQTLLNQLELRRSMLRPGSRRGDRSRLARRRFGDRRAKEAIARDPTTFARGSAGVVVSAEGRRASSASATRVEYENLIFIDRVVLGAASDVAAQASAADCPLPGAPRCVGAADQNVQPGGLGPPRAGTDSIVMRGHIGKDEKFISSGAFGDKLGIKEHIDDRPMALRSRDHLPRRSQPH
jgi:hypothetical protein